MNIEHIIFLSLSVSFFVFGIFCISSIKRNFVSSFALFSVGTTFVLYTLFYLIAYYFTGKGIDYSVIYHVRFGIQGAGFSEYNELILFSLSGLISGVVGIILILRKGAKVVKKPILAVSLSAIATILAICGHPASLDLYRLTRDSGSESFWKYYRHPRIVQTADKTMNLVLIYAESLERSYLDQSVFPGIAKNLGEIEENNTSFTNIGSFPNTGWTIAGMVSSQCGMPLVALSHGNSMAGMDSYLAGAICMGDLLAAKGYNLSYFGGASLDFAGKGSFYRTHGFQKVMGKNELIPELPDQSYITGWGLYDDSLFDLAYEEFEELSSGNQPFGLVLLTLDTHGSDHFSQSCKAVAEQNQMNKNIACTDYLIGKFVDRIKNSSASKNTVIVIVSDHMAIRGTAKLQKTNRKNLFMIIDPHRQKGREEISRKGSTLDLGPTILRSMGFSAELGLGRDLFSDDLTIVEEFNKPGALVKGWRDDLLTFWSFPRVEEKITINAKDRSVSIDDRKLKTPILIQYDDKLQTKIRFQIYNDAIHKTLIQHLSKFDPNDAFFMVDTCKKMKLQWGDFGESGLCYINGTLGSKKLDRGRVTQEKTFTASHLKEIASLPGSNEIFEQRLAQLNTKDQ